MVILRSQNKIIDFFMILAWASPFNAIISPTALCAGVMNSDILMKRSIERVEMAIAKSHYKYPQYRNYECRLQPRISIMMCTCSRTFVCSNYFIPVTFLFLY